MRLSLFIVLLCSLSAASQDQNYGLGGPTSGRVSGVTAETDNPYAALYNPALLPAQATGLFSFSTGAAEARHSTLSQVVVDSPQYRTERGIARTQDFKLPNHSMTVWAAGFTLPFSLPSVFSRRAGIGITVSGPYQKLRSFSALTPYDFYSLRYGTSDSQFKGTISGGIELWPGHFYAGAGITMFLTASGAADGTILSGNPTGRLALDIGFNTAAVVGLLARWEPTNVALVFRQEIDPHFGQSLDGKLEFAGTETFHQPFRMRSSLYFEPQTVELETQHDFEVVKLSLGLSYQAWSRYQPSYLVLEAAHADGTTRTTKTPFLRMKDTVSPRASIEAPVLVKGLVAAGGYRYRPSPVADVSGDANVLDSDSHILGLSLRYRFAENVLLPSNVDLGLYGQYHFFQKREVTKTSADFIGAPRYEYSGNAHTYGLFLQAAL